MELELFQSIYKNEWYKKNTEALPLQFRGQSYINFYTLVQGKLKCLNCWFNAKEKCNPLHMLGCGILTLWATKVCVSPLFFQFKTLCKFGLRCKNLCMICPWTDCHLTNTHNNNNSNNNNNNSNFMQQSVEEDTVFLNRPNSFYAWLWMTPPPAQIDMLHQNHFYLIFIVGNLLNVIVSFVINF